MDIKIPYGKTEVHVCIPEKNLAYVITDGIPGIKKPDEGSIIKKALASPLGSGRIIDLAKRKKSACILVSDVTRPCPSFKFLPYIIDELNSGGISNIKVVFGLGVHRKQTGDERIRLAGKYAAGRARLVDSDPAKCRLVGHTSRGTPVEIFKEVLDSGLLIATGNIEYHYYAGYSGGAGGQVGPEEKLEGITFYDQVRDFILQELRRFRDPYVVGTEVVHPRDTDVPSLSDSLDDEMLITLRDIRDVLERIDKRLDKEDR